MTSVEDHQSLNAGFSTDVVFETPAKDPWKKATFISKLFLRYSKSEGQTLLCAK